MSQPLVPYSPEDHPPLRNPLLVAPPDSVPAIDELESTHSELARLKKRVLERARKAAGDLKIIEHEMKKMRDLEKGKARAMPPNRVKREPSYTPSLDQEERLSPSLTSTSTAPPSSSAVPSINVPGSVPQKLPPEIRKIKKKRKREDESDGEHDSQRPRKLSPHPPAIRDHHHKPSKLSTVSHSKSSASDWDPPKEPRLLYPAPPVLVSSLPAGPRKPIEVKEDFSKAKAPASQVPITTFYSSIEPWLRPIREEDLGWLEYDGDTVGPYVFPELGRHYTEQWEDEDVAIYGGVPAALDFSASRNVASILHMGPPPNAPLPKWDAAGIGEVDLVSDKGLGPTSERLVTALLSAPPDKDEFKVVKAAEDAYEGKRAGSGSTSSGPPPPKEKVLVSEFEERVKDTIRYHGLLDGEPDFSNVAEDTVAIALRKLQRELRGVAAKNKARRARLAEMARDRLAYQEYVDAREALDKNITAIYTKLQKKDGPKVNKKKKKGGEGGGGGGGSSNVNGVNGVNGQSAMPLPNPASLGLGPDEDSTLVVPETLKQLVETRQQWVEVVGGGFEELERQNPGRVRGAPQKSVYEGLDEDVLRLLGPSTVFLTKSLRDEIGREKVA